MDIVYIVSASCQKSIQYSSYTLEFIPCNWFHTIQVKIDERECLQRLVIMVNMFLSSVIIVVCAIAFIKIIQCRQTKEIRQLSK